MGGVSLVENRATFAVGRSEPITNYKTLSMYKLASQGSPQGMLQCLAVRWATVGPQLYHDHHLYDTAVRETTTAPAAVDESSP